jgi:sec-independent protein translocase protein TatB
MFDISWGELMLIGVVALIFIGPKELPGVLRMVGQWVGKIRRMAGEFQSQFQEAMREAEMADLKKHVDELNETARGLKTSYDPLKDFESAVSDSSLTGAVSSSSTGSTSAAPGSTTPAATSTEASHASPHSQTPPASEPGSDVMVPLPQTPPPVSEKDFAPAESSPAASPDQDGKRA